MDFFHNGLFLKMIFFIMIFFYNGLSFIMDFFITFFFIQTTDKKSAEIEISLNICWFR